MVKDISIYDGQQLIGVKRKSPNAKEVYSLAVNLLNELNIDFVELTNDCIYILVENGSLHFSGKQLKEKVQEFSNNYQLNWYMRENGRKKFCYRM